MLALFTRPEVGSSECLVTSTDGLEVIWFLWIFEFGLWTLAARGHRLGGINCLSKESGSSQVFVLWGSQIVKKHLIEVRLSFRVDGLVTET